MSKSTNLLMISALIVITFIITTSFSTISAASTAGNHRITYFPATVTGGCNGSTADCLAGGADLEFDDLEFEMDSESNRRILAYRRRYISYSALSRNNVPCSRRGASYYNCRSGGQANPYSRGCSAITRCRR